MKNESEECCPEFIPELWDEKTFQWDDKRFVRDRVLTFFYIPLNFSLRRASTILTGIGFAASDFLRKKPKSIKIFVRNAASA